jgi:hypothetical protein
MPPLPPSKQAFVAFDLDNTLGFFELTNPLAYFWSPDFLSNPEQSRSNGGTAPPISARLEKKLARVRETFARLLVQNEALLFSVLRPNLDAMMGPLVKAYRKGLLRTAVLYSNSSNSESLRLAKTLIEKHYKIPGFFSYLSDHWDPLRDADRSAPLRPFEYVEPRKTMTTLQVLFHAGTGLRKEIPYEHILFIDDRDPKHALAAQEGDGLTYLVPTAYFLKPTVGVKKQILQLAMDALDKEKLLNDPEYLHSAFCYRHIPYDYTKIHTIAGFPDLFQFISREIHEVEGRKGRWSNDEMRLSVAVNSFLKKVEADA